MQGDGLFFQAFVYLTAAVVSVPVAKRLGLGSVLGYLIAGVVIGPFVLGLIGNERESVMHFAEFGVVLMLFVIGLELEPSVLWRLRGTLLGMGGLQVALTAAAIAGAAIAVGLEWRPAVAIGLILSLSSTAIVLQSLSERGLLKSDAGERSFAVLLFQDIAVIPMLAVLPLLTVGMALEGSAGGEAAHGATAMDQFPGWARGLVTFGAVAAIVLAGRFLVRPVFRFIARSEVREVFTAAALLIVVGIALLMTAVGLSPALGAFVAGVVLANSEYRHELESDMEPFKGLLLGLFFLAVGASVDFALVGTQLGAMAAVVLGLIVVKLIVLLALARLFRMSLDQGLLFALALAQGGELCFVLLSFSAQTSILDGATASLLVAAVALSMALTPLLLLLHEKVIRPRICSGSPVEREPDEIDEENPVIIAGFGAFGTIVGRFLVANGVPTTVLDVDADQIDLLRRVGLQVFYADASRDDLLRAAGAAKARLLLVATGEGERTLSIVRTARKHFPNLEIFARAHVRTEAYDLMEAGVEHVFRESLDSSLRMGTEILRRVGFRAHQAHRAALSFRRHDERNLRELAPIRHEEKVFYTRARESNLLLEKLLQAELGPAFASGDEAWDAESLRAEFGKPKAD